MSKVLVEDTSLTAIGNALRSKLGETRIEYEPGLISQNIQRVFQSPNAIGLGQGYRSGVGPGGSRYETFYFPGASTIEAKVSGNSYGSTGSSALHFWLGTYEDRPSVKPTYFSSSVSQSASTITTKTHTGDTITLEWGQHTYASSTQYYFVQLTPYDADGNALQEEVEGQIPIEKVNEYKPAEMGEVINSSLGPIEDLQTTKIYYSSGVSNATLNFSEYVKNYDNIRQIIWCCSSNVVCIFNHTDYLANIEANNAEPVRINKFGKDSSGYAMSASPQYATPDKTTDFYYFDKDEWDAGGDLKLYSHSSGSITTLTYARYCRYIYLVYKKED